jgi:hypothetical protein
VICCDFAFMNAAEKREKWEEREEESK